MIEQRLAAVVAVVVLASMTAGSYGALVTWNPTAAQTAWNGTDFDTYKTGPASWSVTTTGDIDRSAFVGNSDTPDDWGYAMDDGDGAGNNPAPSHVELTLGSALDFSTSAITVSFDMIFGRSGNDKELQMIGFNGSSAVFRYTWNVDGTDNNSLDVELYNGSQSQMSADYGSQHTTNQTYYGSSG